MKFHKQRKRSRKNYNPNYREQFDRLCQLTAKTENIKDKNLLINAFNITINA